ncbi:dihydrodipicolinate synthase family protein [Rouxiella chamberiensis]|uniref:Dihydrodipicolinate synthase family protein n=1 Tax=Rouxiella chamberiensis TaxID=1513468 RepID=A0ABY7HR25_9GAMM|nr:dihydrodipicolinate synthase family protein [Rouxiella chamberiensis]WAT01844.1 dihydrodipicolinate synthase family protein [Rouxiella chamberiensis]
MTAPLFHGIIPPVPTLFTADEQLDKEGMKRLIDFTIEGGVNGLFFLGSAGEFAHMSEALRHEVASFCTAYVDKRVPVLIGAAHSGTEATLSFARHAKSVGADGVVIVNPFYNPLSEENIYLHYSYLAENLALPIVIYNFPALTGQSIPVEVIKRLAENYTNIVGLKDTVDSLNHIRETIQAVKPVRPDFAVFAGYDEYLFGTLILGGAGSIPASANFAPSLTCGIYQAWQEGRLDRAVALQQRLSWLPPLYALDTPFYNVIKYAIQQVGVEVSVHSLRPAQTLSEARQAKVREILHQANLL